MSTLLIFGPGYTASRIGAALGRKGWHVLRVARTPSDNDMRFSDDAAILPAIAAASHILSSVPPDADGDPVLTRYEAALAASPARWIGYLSSTGVYGDAAGGWVDEATPTNGRRGGRNVADAAWRALHGEARIFRLPGIYGPGRSALDRVAAGRAHRIDLPDQVFSRVHIDDIVGGVLASIDRGPPGAYNLSDDAPCSQNRVIEAASDLLGARGRPCYRWRKRTCPPRRSLSTRRIAASRTARRSVYSAGHRVFPIIAPVCARSSRTD